MLKQTPVKPIEAALEKIPNRFKLTVCASRRWEHIVSGAPPLVPTRPGDHILDVVLEEIVEGKVEVDDETREIHTIGEPMQEVSDEPLFSEAILPDSKSVKDVLGDDSK